MMNHEFWETNAAVWAEAVSAQLLESRKVTGPAMISEILHWQPRTLLDLGCGEGWIASKVLPHGISYTGFDFSDALIEIARGSHAGATFASCSYDQIVGGQAPFTGPFDLATFNFSLFDEDIRPLFRKLHGLLGSRGTVVVQTLHPCFTLKPYKSAWQTEEFHAWPQTANGRVQGKMPWFGRTLSDWIEAFSESNWRVKRLVEPLNPMSSSPWSIIFSLEPREDVAAE